MAEFTPQQITWLERYMRIVSGRQVQQAASQITTIVQNASTPAGDFTIVPDDLTANTSEYVYTHPISGLTYLFCNGATISQATYPDLYTVFGANRYGADSGGNFLLPDARGRTLFLAGTNSATDVGDNDGVAEASRQPKHTHTSTSLTASGTASLSASLTGTPSITDPGHDHLIFTGAGQTGGNTLYKVPAIGIDPQLGRQDYTDAAGAAFRYMDTSTTGITAGIGTLAVSGSGSVSGLSVGGTAGSGMSGSDAISHIVLGSLVVKF